MKLNNGEFETMAHAGLFWIAITEQEHNPDGRIFWGPTSTYKLDQQTARDLLNELKLYLGDV